MNETKVNQLDNGECRHQQKILTTRTYNSISDAPSLVFMSATERHTTTPKIQLTLTSPGCDVKRNPRRISNLTEENGILVCAPVAF